MKAQSSDLREDVLTGMAGNHLSQLFTGLQHHKTGLFQALQWAERANRIGWQNAGIDVAKIDEEMQAANEDVDNSIRLTGDTTTHIHLAPQDAQQPPPEQPKQEPQQPTQTPPVQGGNQTPAWMKWALATALGAAGLGPIATYMMLKPRPQQETGGSIFRFKVNPGEFRGTQGDD